ncbi:MAG: hypothetical protein M1819_003162 [Sarea resinae]|nr:MAG: hypothetical protein M1819_003162 [Sarea resinae]
MASQSLGIQVLKQGDGTNKPSAGDQVTIEYTGYLYNAEAGEANGFKGKQFDSSVGRGDFVTAIGVGRVIKGSFGSSPHQLT